MRGGATIFLRGLAASLLLAAALAGCANLAARREARQMDSAAIERLSDAEVCRYLRAFGDTESGALPPRWQAAGEARGLLHCWREGHAFWARKKEDIQEAGRRLDP